MTVPPESSCLPGQQAFICRQCKLEVWESPVSPHSPPSCYGIHHQVPLTLKSQISPISLYFSPESKSQSPLTCSGVMNLGLHPSERWLVVMNSLETVFPLLSSEKVKRGHCTTRRRWERCHITAERGSLPRSTAMIRARTATHSFEQHAACLDCQPPGVSGLASALQRGQHIAKGR